MDVVIDAIPVRYGGFAVALESLLVGWAALGTGDQLHVVVSEEFDQTLPASVTVHRLRIRRPSAAWQVLAQTLMLRRVCRDTDADVLFSILPSTALGPVGCPKVIVVHDLRHELRPEQFSRPRRILRTVSYGAGYRDAAAIACVSERTRRDLLRSRPWLEQKPVRVLRWGADHVDGWARRSELLDGEPYALAFGHFVNKGVGRIIEAWRILADRGEQLRLVVVGIPADELQSVRAAVAQAGLVELVTPLSWLGAEDFQAYFATAEMIVFPSDFEGYGLPAVEALRLGKALVISPDEALLEVTGGLAAVMDGWNAGALADAVARARQRTPQQLADARASVQSRTWSRMATDARELLMTVIGRP